MQPTNDRTTTEQKEYCVEWHFHCAAKNPEEAAKLARSAMLMKKGVSDFDVLDSEGNKTPVNLEELSSQVKVTLQLPAALEGSDHLSIIATTKAMTGSKIINITDTVAAVLFFDYARSPATMDDELYNATFKLVSSGDVATATTTALLSSDYS
ncbi:MULTISPECIES: hypothetical protein [Halomonadaceae]|uniref:hypothetical protein n=1 Tax=Halomonadaceae TaxID=28256 RepID=UPI003CF4F536